jgi:hypothetical protein
MSRTKTISGIIVYKNIGTGFWGIEELSGKQWLPINLPKNLKQEGKRVTLRVQKLNEDMNMFMWGTPVKILG